MEISVIVPVYNVKPFLKKCVDSLINQSCSVDFEIILVDDGSTDGSAQICDSYKDVPNVKIIHKANGGLSDARNCGMDAAVGEYYIFVDSDDYVEKNHIESLYQLINTYNTKMAITGYYINNMSQELIHDEGVYSRDYILEKMMQQDSIDVSAWSKIFHKALFKNVRFPLNTLYEDMAIVPLLVLLCDYIAINTTPTYHYIMRAGSISHDDLIVGQLDLLKNINNVGEAVKGVVSENIIGQRFIKDSMVFIKKMINIPYKEQFATEFGELLYKNKYWRKRFLNKRVPVKLKIELLILKINKKLFGLMYKRAQSKQYN